MIKALIIFSSLLFINNSFALECVNWEQVGENNYMVTTRDKKLVITSTNRKSSKVDFSYKGNFKQKAGVVESGPYLLSFNKDTQDGVLLKRKNLKAGQYKVIAKVLDCKNS